MKTKLILLFLIFVLTSCVTETIQETYTTGTVTLVKVGNGFWGIIGDDGTKYEPLSIPVSFQIDNKRVSFKYQERKDTVSPHNWGMVIELISINAISF